MRACACIRVTFLAAILGAGCAQGGLSDVKRPSDALSWLSPQAQNRKEVLRRQFLDECMRREGFLVAPWNESNSLLIFVAGPPDGNDSRMYRIEHGYGAADVLLDRQALVPTEPVVENPGSNYSGSFGNCEEKVKRIFSVLDAAWMKIADQRGRELERHLGSTEYRTMEARWRTCMQEKGYQVATIVELRASFYKRIRNIQPGDKQAIESLRRDEIEASLVDWGCQELLGSNWSALSASADASFLSALEQDVAILEKEYELLRKQLSSWGYSR
jgi:hypothetical protein